MRVVKFVAYLFYRYYSSSGPRKGIPYFSTLCALVLLFYIHLIQLLILLNIVNIIPIQDGNTNVGKFFKMALFLSPIFFLFVTLIKKSELQSMQYEEQKVKKGNIYLIVYIVLSFSFMIFLALVRKGKV